jgi:hypothetical protein
MNGQGFPIDGSDWPDEVGLGLGTSARVLQSAPQTRERYGVVPFGFTLAARSSSVACAAASRAMGRRYGLQLT